MSPRLRGNVTADIFPAEVAIIPPSSQLITSASASPSPAASGPVTPTLASIASTRDLPPDSQRLSRVRLIATTHAVFVFADSVAKPGTAERVFAKQLTAPPLNAATKATRRGITEGSGVAEDGTTIVWSYGKGCGCGSRLRAFNPYRDERTLSINDSP